MGSWGTGTFENDTASDWAAELEGAADLSVVTDCLEQALESGDEYLDSDEACEALAACEVVARLKGKWGPRDSHSEPLDRWVEAHPSHPTKAVEKQALAAIDRVLKAPSELLEVWEESDDKAAWRKSVLDLRARVAG